jgi:hypothetical protein
MVSSKRTEETNYHCAGELLKKIGRNWLSYLKQVKKNSIQMLSTYNQCKNEVMFDVIA